MVKLLSSSSVRPKALRPDPCRSTESAYLPADGREGVSLERKPVGQTLSIGTDSKYSAGQRIKRAEANPEDFQLHDVALPAAAKSLLYLADTQLPRLLAFCLVAMSSSSTVSSGSAQSTSSQPTTAKQEALMRHARANVASRLRQKGRPHRVELHGHRSRRPHRRSILRFGQLPTPPGPQEQQLVNGAGTWDEAFPDWCKRMATYSFLPNLEASAGNVFPMPTYFASSPQFGNHNASIASAVTPKSHSAARIVSSRAAYKKDNPISYRLAEKTFPCVRPIGALQ
ncbi:hypothetical protein KC338_g166 [Hortaea werneckii]|nr:hypothetical protein KC338_g166 [Hortaea werneckii]